jgi:aminopeptidase-like protein
MGAHAVSAKPASKIAPQGPDTRGPGAIAYALIEELYPICRSITGPGVRQTLDIVDRFIPLQRSEVPSGTKVFDWEVPNELTIRDAYIKDASGERLIDFKQHNLHVVNYSVPVRATMTLDELRVHLHTLPDNPDWIPYRTSYYRDSWGFCLSQRQLDALPAGPFEVVIDSDLKPGALTYGEALLPGTSSEEVLIYTHICHPSLCNDNLSAIAVACLLAQKLAAGPRRFSYRFVFGPATIGSITWLAQNEGRARHIRHGLVLASLGDRGGLTFKRSRRGDAEIDRIMAYLAGSGRIGAIEDFSPYGYDERQFCSPGFNLPVGRLTRTPNARYPEYHTSADNLDFVTPAALADSLAACEEIIAIIEANARYRNLSPKCEPRLGPRGLFRNTGGRNPSEFEHAVLWILNQSDGGPDLLAIAEKSKIPFTLIAEAAKALLGAGLLAPVETA